MDFTKLKIRHSGFKLIKLDIYSTDIFQTTANRVLIRCEKMYFRKQNEVFIGSRPIKHRIIGFGLKNVSCLFHVCHDSNLEKLTPKKHILCSI